MKVSLVKVWVAVTDGGGCMCQSSLDYKRKEAGHGI